MKNFTRLFLTGVLLILFSSYGIAQQKPVISSVVGKLERITPKLADIDKTSMYGAPFVKTREGDGFANGINDPEQAEESIMNRTWYPSKTDNNRQQIIKNAKQKSAAAGVNNPTPNVPSVTVNVNMDGLYAPGFTPSDNNLAVGPNHVIQMINNGSSSNFEIWNKAGAVVQGKTILSSLTGIAGAGDPVVIYDQLADRFLMTEFAAVGVGYINELVIAISTTPDPTGSWKIYSYQDNGYFSDYPKYAVWNNGYYATSNEFNTSGTAYIGSYVWAFDRAAMLSGASTATAVKALMTDASQRYYSMAPVCLEGTTPSPNQSGMFAFLQDDAWVGGGAVDSIFTFELIPDFVTPANTVVGPFHSLATLPYNTNVPAVPQQGSGTGVPNLNSRLMHQVIYRNFGTSESIVCNTVDNVGSGRNGVHWWELRRPETGNWNIYQEGVLAPGTDNNGRFMAGIAINGNGDIGMIYNISGSSMYPSIRFIGRNSCDPVGTMTSAEVDVMDGTTYNSVARYGDYNTLATDPVNGTFWGTAQYNAPGYGTYGNWTTRIANFTLSPGQANFTQQPSNTSVCAGTPATFTVTVNGLPPLTYQWQESTDGGATWNALSNSPPYSGVTTGTLTINPVTAGMNNYQYNCVASSSCGSPATSNAAVLTITTLSQGGSVLPATTSVCPPTNSTTLTLSGSIGNVIQWESSIDGGTTWTTISNTTLTYTAVNVLQNTIYRALVQSSGCSAAYSATAAINFNNNAVPALTITEDNGTTLCAGTPTLLTVVGAPTINTVTVGSGAISVIIPDNNATGVSLPLTVSGIPGNASAVSVNFNITHTWDGDLTLFLMAANGQVLNLVNQEGGSGDNFTNTTISSTGITTLSSSAPPFTGTFAADGSMTAPTPAGFVISTATFPALYTSPNGTWNFGARDNAGGDIGTILNWTLNVSYQTGGGPLGAGYTFLWSPAAGLNATNINPVAAAPNVTTTYTVNVTNGSGCSGSSSVLITVNQLPKVTAQPVNDTLCATSIATFSITATGTGIGYQWQESTDGGLTYQSITNGGIYSGATTPTLTLTGVTFAMNNNLYRCNVNGICSPVATSHSALLMVKPLPALTLSPTITCGGVAGINGTLLTAGGADSYVWSPVAGLYTNANASTAYTGTNRATVYAAPTAFTVYTVTGTSVATGCSNSATTMVNYTPPAPAITPNPVTMCLGDAAVRLTSSTSSSTSISVSSGAISIPVPDNNQAGAISNLTVSGIPAGATISAMAVTWNMTHTWDGDMVFALKAPNSNILNLDWYLSGTGGNSATTGFVNTKISSAGVNALSSGSNPYTGTFKADAHFGSSGGPIGYNPTGTTWQQLWGTPNGTYTLAMYDGGPGDVGTLTSWKLDITYVIGVPATPAIWSPLAGLYTNAGATVPYTGTPSDTVYTQPTPAGSYTYQATVNSLPLPPVSATMSNYSSWYAATITFNVKNNNAYPVTLSGISSGTAFTGATQVSVYSKPSAINGLPGAITAANGWTQFGTATVTGLGFGNGTQPFISGLNLQIPAGATYGIVLQALQGAGSNLLFSNVPTNLISSAGGCDIITGAGIGYAGNPVPAAPIFTPYYFNGSVSFVPGIPACTSPARTVVVTVNQPVSLNPALPVNATVCTNNTTSFSVAATAGTAPITYQWQVSTDGGNTFGNTSDGNIYSGSTTNTLTITAPPVSMNGYSYRCAVQGAPPCGVVNSAMRTLTVNPLPTVVITAAPYLKLFPGLITTITSTSSPAAATNTWFKDGSVVSGATAASLAVNVDGLGTYSLMVTDVNGCINTSNEVTITDSAMGKVFIYPNPNSGQFQVRYNPNHNGSLPRGINVYDAKGSRILTKDFTLGMPYQRMDIDLSNQGTGVYWIEVVDVNGQRLIVGRVEVLR